MAKKPNRLTLAMISVPIAAISFGGLVYAPNLFSADLICHLKVFCKGMARPIYGQNLWHKSCLQTGHVEGFSSELFWSRIGELNSAHDVISAISPQPW